MKWNEVKKVGNPKEDFECIVLHPSGYGYGIYSNMWDFDNNKKLSIKKWFLDFDNVEYDDQVTYWCKIEFPKGYMED